MSLLQNRLAKNSPRDRDGIRQGIVSDLGFVASLGNPVELGSRILDVGCGIGDSVSLLMELGYDAYGVDVLELWGRDFDQYWESRDPPKGDHLSRLHAVDATNYRLPFPDGYFDYAFSDQVFEHVSNYEAVCIEIARVLKPGAVSLHRFPGPNGLVESHLKVPFPALCHSKAYLAFWAVVGLRSDRQLGMNCRDTLATNLEMIRFCHYPTKRTLSERARSAGVTIRFLERQDLAFRRVGLIPGVLAKIPSPLRATATWAASFLSQRVMILEGKGRVDRSETGHFPSSAT